MKLRKKNMLQKSLLQAAKIIRQGGVVAFPTETVYGLGANALNPLAVAKIYQLKKRPLQNPLIVHISKLNQLKSIVSEVSLLAQKLIDAFWPGPLTLILPKQNLVPNQVTAGLETVAVRMPNHPIALQLIDLAGTPIAAPSANRSGEPSPTHHKHVYLSLGDQVEMIIKAGSCSIGVESTIINLQSTEPIILRAGGLPREKIEEVIGKVKVYENLSKKAVLGKFKKTRNLKLVGMPKSVMQKIICPGVAFRHYAPQAPLVLVPKKFLMIDQMLQLAKHYLLQKKRVGILTVTEELHFFKGNYEVISLGKKDDLRSVSANLFASFYKFNDLAVEVIIARSFSEKGLGLAVMDRLKRASVG